MAKQVNVALMGAGFMGKAHSNAYRQVWRFFDDLSVRPVMKVLCEANEDVGREAAELYGWEELSTDWKATVNRDDIDIVDICLPGHLHAEVAIEAAKAGKHIICEKPLANSLDEAKNMLKAVDKAGVKNLCGFTYRFNPAIATIKKMITKGDLGDIYHVRATYQQDWIIDPDFPINWRLQKKGAGSGALGDIGAHIVDMAQYLVGEISDVSAAMQTFIKERPVSEAAASIATGKQKRSRGKKGKVDVDDATIILARFKNRDTLGTFEATRFAAGRRNHNKIEIYGSKGSVVFDQEQMHQFLYYNHQDPDDRQGFRVVLATDGGHPYTEAWWPPGHNIGYEHLFVHEFHDFLAQLRRKRVTYPTFEDGLRCQQVLDAAERAAKSGKWEKV